MGDLIQGRKTKEPKHRGKVCLEGIPVVGGQELHRPVSSLSWPRGGYSHVLVLAGSGRGCQ